MSEVICICVNVGPMRERIVAKFTGSDAWDRALDEAPRHGSAATVTVDVYPPRCPGVAFEDATAATSN